MYCPIPDVLDDIAHYYVTRRHMFTLVALYSKRIYHNLWFQGILRLLQFIPGVSLSKILESNTEETVK